MHPQIDCHHRGTLGQKQAAGPAGVPLGQSPSGAWQGGCQWLVGQYGGKGGVSAHILLRIFKYSMECNIHTLPHLLFLPGRKSGDCVLQFLGVQQVTSL